MTPGIVASPLFAGWSDPLPFDIQTFSPALFVFVSGTLIAIAIARRYWPSESRLKEARRLLDEHEHRQRIAAQWPAVMKLVALHESENAAQHKRQMHRSLVELLRDEDGMPAALREIPIPVRARALDDFSGGPSGASGPHRKIGGGE